MNSVHGDVHGGSVVQGRDVRVEESSYGGDHHDFHGGTFHGPFTYELHHHHPAPEAEGPVRVGAIPEEAAHYRPRDAVAGVDADLAFGSPAPRLVLSGAGGVGKTQLAARLARTLLRSPDGEPPVDVLVWTDAASRERITFAYAQAARRLLPSVPDHPEEAAALFLNWLADPDGHRGRRWLVVWDDLADPGAVRDLWHPHGRPDGRVIVTTRRRDHSLTVQGNRLVDVDVYTPHDARAFLGHALDGTGVPYTPDGLDALATALGRLPLALGQAVSYMAELGMGCPAYLEALHDRMGTLDEVFPDWEAPTPLAATWDLSLERADSYAPRGLARPLMGLVALLDGEGVPGDVLTAPPVLDHLAGLRDGGGDGGGDHTPGGVTERQVARALASLRRLSLIRCDAPQGQAPVAVFGAHTLVQRATREHTRTRPTREGVRALADALLHVWPDHGGDAERTQRLRANTAALCSRTRDGVPVEDWLWAREAHRVLFQAGASLGESGRADHALAYWRRLAETAHRRLGPEHADTRTCRHNTAHWTGEVGDLASAVRAYTELVLDIETRFGPGHPEAFGDRNNLAAVRARSGDLAAGLRDLEDLLVDRTVVLGEDHPSTLLTLNNLGEMRSQAGDLDGAAVAFEDLLEDLRRVNGPEHPHTLAALHNIAHLWGRTGDARRAAAALRALVPRMEGALGPAHPNALVTRQALAYWENEAGTTDGAAESPEGLLDRLLEAHGPDHPAVLSARNGLAHRRGEAGDAAGAVEDFERLLPDLVRVLGPDHPDVLLARQNLVHWRGMCGDPAGAVSGLEALLPDLVRVLGPDHPTALGVRNNLCAWRNEAGDTAAALTGLEDLLADQTRALGADHPDTLGTRGDLAVTTYLVGDTARARSEMEALLADQFRVLGPDHPRTEATRQILSYWDGSGR